MKTGKIKSYQVLSATGIFIAGLILIGLFDNWLWYLGGILVAVSVFYTGFFVFQSFEGNGKRRMRSRTRETLLKYQNKRS